MRTAILIAAKDLRQRFRDRSVILFAVVAPLGLALIFSQMLAGATEFKAAYVVANMDGGALSTSFRKDVLGALVDAGVASIKDVATPEVAKASVEAGDADAAIVIPVGFSTAILSGQRSSIEVVGGQDAGLATEIARSVSTRFADGIASTQLAILTVGDLQGAPPDPAGVAAIVAAAQVPSLQLTDVQTSLRQLSPATYFSAGMAILFLFFAAQVGAVSMFEERRLGTLSRMLAGPIAPTTILAGKTLGSFLIGIVALTILAVATTTLVGADWGPPVGVAVIIIAAVVSAIGISTLVTSFMKTQDSAGAANSAVAITLGIVGGTFFPSSQAPELMARLSLVTPHAWFLRGLGEMQGAGASAADALPSIAILLAMGLVTGAIGFARARRMVTAR
jgi:ABC-2 type transport system permease protein